MLKIDLHIHSLHSGHAYGTFYEIVEDAKRKNMFLIAITDHGPAMRGIISDIHFQMGPRAPKTFDSLRVLWGCEANVINENGDIDLTSQLIKKLDLVVLGFHEGCGYNDINIKKNTEVFKKAMMNSAVKIITHPTNPQVPYDCDEIFKFAIEKNILLELNLSYLKSSGERKFNIFKKMVDIVKSKGKKLIVNSDAHFLHEIADDSILKQYQKKLGLTDDMIINNFPNELEEFLGLNK